MTPPRATGGAPTPAQSPARTAPIDAAASTTSAAAALRPAAPPLVLRRPEELRHLDMRRSAVIEASAGTGKTYLLEHLVLDMILQGRARLDQILVVTFTERATAELVVRIREKIEQALAITAPERIIGWTIDSAARARLQEARRSFDQATITTIHAFCQRVLTDEPLATRRLLVQTQVDGRQAFAEVFRDVLRRQLATDPTHTAYLDGYLATGRGVTDLEELLYRATTARGPWANPYDQATLARLAQALSELDLERVTEMEKALKERDVHHSTVTALTKRLRQLAPQAQAALGASAWGHLLACFDALSEATFAALEIIAAFTDLPTPVPPTLRPLQLIAQLTLRAAPPLEEAIAQRFLPLIEDRLDERKMTEGLYDYDDMIRGADAAIGGTGGAALIDRLRARYKFALVDEAQDTETAQWRIFRRVFLDSDAPNPVVLIGDPKQAIYGFRGADVHTYVQAREDIQARGGAVLALDRNFRSHPEVLDATNAILDDRAQRPFFSGPHIRYDRPVTAVKAPLGDGPGVTLFHVEAPSDRTTPARIGVIRRALREAIVAEIERLRTVTPGVRLRELFVLTRSNAEAREVSGRLHQQGIPNVLFKPDDVFKSTEATQVRALLQAIASPLDRAARLAAWLTPFFDVGLEELAGCADPPSDHPLMARLLGWNVLAEARAYDWLWGRILDDSGVARRLRLSPAGLRRLTNYRHLFDILHASVSARPRSVAELADWLGALATGRRRASDADDDVQRLETEADAVRVMTIHAAKGLEADFVFIYGGLTAGRAWRGNVHALLRGQDRARCAGRPRRKADVQLIDAARGAEEERLLYVAMTRARRHLYLPFFPATEEGELDGQSDRGAGDFDPFKKLTGEYRHVNQRLRVLAGDPASAALFRRVPLSLTAPPLRDEATTARALSAWTPAPLSAEGGASGRSDGRDQDRTDGAHGADGRRDEDEDEDEASDASTHLARLQARRRGFVITSYSRMSQATGGYRTSPRDAGAREDIVPSLSAIRPDGPPELLILDPLERLDDDDATADSPSDPGRLDQPLPGGVASGLFLHALLEKAPLGELPELPAWRAQPEVRHLIEAEGRRWERDPRHFDEAARLVHAALTVPLPMPDGGTLPGLARAVRVRREADFLFPLSSAPPPPSGGGEDTLVHEGGFVRGALDVLFEHDGRICFADWKSNVLPDFSAPALRQLVALNYQLQIQIYTLAVARLLGITDRADYDRRFGGLVYVFLRGLTSPRRAPDDGLYISRPDFADVQRWERTLAASDATHAGDAA